MTRPIKTPIAESYWVIPGKLLAGEYPGHWDEAVAKEKIGKLINAGVDFFLDLTESGELKPYEWYLPSNVEYKRVPIVDVSIPTQRHMEHTLALLNDALSRGKVAYVHCWGGIGRTGTVVGCLLSDQLGDGEKALTQLASLWNTVPKSRHKPHSPETDEQKQFVARWRKP